MLCLIIPSGLNLRWWWSFLQDYKVMTVDKVQDAEATLGMNSHGVVVFSLTNEGLSCGEEISVIIVQFVTHFRTASQVLRIQEIM